MRVLEFGNYIAPAYAGMILAEQGHQVTKWVDSKPSDPIHSLNRGADLWDWINHRKAIEVRHPRELLTFDIACPTPFDTVVENVRPETLSSWGLDPHELAARHNLVWVSLRSEIPGRSFDVIAQARATLAEFGWIEFWLGDTSFGLWAAFKALSKFSERSPGHYPIYQASCLRKLVEGELVVEVERSRGKNPFEVDRYQADEMSGATVEYKGELMEEPARGRGWMMENLKHDGTGRIVV